MGCHTWFYEKKEIDYEVAIKELHEKIKLEIKFYKNIVYNRKKIKRFLSYHNVSIETGRKYLELLKRQSRMISKNLCQEATLEQWCRMCSKEHTRYIRNKGVYVTKNRIHPHDLFRIHDYPENVLFSLQETLDFIEKNKDKITYYHSYKDKTFNDLLIEFWETYPNGMIDFG